MLKEVLKIVLDLFFIDLHLKIFQPYQKEFLAYLQLCIFSSKRLDLVWHTHHFVQETSLTSFETNIVAKNRLLNYHSQL